MPTKTDLRRFNPTSRQVQTQSPRATPEAFGAGVGLALGNIAQSLTNKALLSEETETAKEALARAHIKRQRTQESSKAYIGLIQLSAELKSEQLELGKNWPTLDGEGLTEALAAAARTKIAEYRRQLPEHLLAVFNPLLESIQMDAATLGYNAQTLLENTKFKTDVAIMVQRWDDDILETVGDPDATFHFSAYRLRTVFEDAPLGTVKNEELYKQHLLTLKSTWLVKLAENEHVNDVSEGAVPDRLVLDGKAWRSKGIVAAGMTSAAEGILLAISGPESNDVYNSLYSPFANRFFSDFSKHPNDPVQIPFGDHKGEFSSAAGRYQILIGTWNEAVREMAAAGIIITDFSPESQDRVAWHIAQRDYARETGRSLTADLSIGNIETLAVIKMHLAKTWPGLSNLSDEDFFNFVAQAQGTPSSLIYRQEFADIAYNTRFDLINDGYGAGNAIQSKMTADYVTETNRLVEEMRILIAGGKGSALEIAELGKNRNLPLSQIEDLNEKYAEVNKEALAVTAGMAAIRGGTFNPGTETGRFQAESIANTKWVWDALNSGDPAAMREVVNLFNTMGYIPSNFENNLTNLINSQDPRKAFFGYEALSGLMDGGYEAFKTAFGSDIVKSTILFDNLRQLLPEEDLIKAVRLDPAFKEIREQNAKDLRKDWTDNPNKFSIEGIYGKLGFNRGVNPKSFDRNTGQILQAKYMSLYSYFYSISGNKVMAAKSTKEFLLREWGEITVGPRTTVMEFPPHFFHDPFPPDKPGSYDYIVEQAVSALGLPDATNLFIMTDKTTKAQVASGDDPTWQLILFDEYGMARWARIRDTVSYKASRGKIDPGFGDALFRWRPEYTDEMVKLNNERVFQAQELVQTRATVDDLWNSVETLDDAEVAARAQAELEKTRLQRHIAGLPRWEQELYNDRGKTPTESAYTKAYNELTKAGPAIILKNDFIPTTAAGRDIRDMITFRTKIYSSDEIELYLEQIQDMPVPVKEQEAMEAALLEIADYLKDIFGGH